MFRIVLAALMAVTTMPAGAQQVDSYPSRSVRIIVNSPSGNPDILARLLAQKLTVALGQPFVVEDMPGAGGGLAARFVASAHPDGYVLYLGDSGTLAINPAIRPNLPYSPLRDFTPVTALVDVPTVLVLQPSVRATTLQEFVTLAQSKPGEMDYGSPGVGSIHYFTHEIFAERAGIKLQHVPFRSAGDMVGAILAGMIQGPAGLRSELVGRLQPAVAKALRDSDVAERMIALGMQMQESGTSDYEQFMKDDLARYDTLVRHLGIQLRE